MAYDEKLATRVREVFGLGAEVSERKMFGGVAFMIRGHMCCGIVTSDLMVRVGPEQYQDALTQPHARPMDFTGRPLVGMIYVSAAGLRTRAALAAWVERGMTFVASLPAKPPKKARPRKVLARRPR